MTGTFFHSPGSTQSLICGGRAPVQIQRFLPTIKNSKPRVRTVRVSLRRARHWAIQLLQLQSEFG